jgi:cytochrome c-type biogenesis protein CcmE
MKRIISLSLIAMTALAVAAGTTKIKDIVAKPESFNGKTIKVVGKVKKFKAKESKAGNAYYTFDLVEDDRGVSVYGRGKLPKEPKDGDKVEVEGKFEKERIINKGQENEFTVKNQVTVGGKKGEEPKLKILTK